MAFCWTHDELNQDMSVITKNCNCRYHPQSKPLPIDMLSPKGLCPEVFHSIWPAAFAAFSSPDAGFEEQKVYRCPAGQVAVRLERRKNPSMRWMEKMARKVVSMALPVEILQWRIFMVIEKSEDCPYGLQVGEEYEVNVGNTGDLCPAAANSFFPHFAKAMKGVEKVSPCVACPDHKTHVRGQLGASEAPAPLAEVESDLPIVNPVCEHSEELQIEIVSGHRDPYWVKGRRYSLPELLEFSGLPCLSYLNVIAPYVYSLKNGGKLGYYTYNYRSAVVQCPSSDHNIVTRVEISKNRKEVSFEVQQQTRSCPRGMDTGTRFVLDLEEGYFWFCALAALSPYLLNPHLVDQHEITLPESERETPFRCKILAGDAVPV